MFIPRSTKVLSGIGERERGESRSGERKKKEEKETAFALDCSSLGNKLLSQW